ncbi:MAG: hypothetical protein C0501_18080 [Isosphaera sp.]|nr:hypothetical protein [Isosphaera sp.]
MPHWSRRPKTGRPTSLRAERLEARDVPVADIYVGVPLVTAIPTHANYAETGDPGTTLIYVSPDGLNPDGPTTGAEGTLTNPRTLTDAVDFATANHPGATLVLRGGEYRGVTANVDARLTLQAYRQETPWLNGAVVVTNWEQVTVDLGGAIGERTFWRMGTTGFDPDGPGGSGPRNFEFPENLDFHNVDIAANPMAGAGEQVFVTNTGGAPTPVKQVGLYRELTGNGLVTRTVDAGGTPTATTYRFRRNADNRLIDPNGVPVADAFGRTISDEGAPTGGTSPADFAAVTDPAANLALMLRADGTVDPDRFFVDSVGNFLYVGFDPFAAGRTVEVTAAGTGLNVTAAEVTVRGLGFKYYGRAGVGANDSTRRLVLEDSAFTFNGQRGYSATGDDTVVRNNRLVANGQVGGSSSRADRLLLDGNTYAFNNVERFATNWSAAGTKITSAEDLVIRNNRFENNFSTSLWLDINVVRAAVVNNTVVGGGIAFFVEISHDNVVAFNVARGASQGVQVSGSSGTRVYNNTFFNSNVAAQVRDTTRVNDVNEDGGVTGSNTSPDGNTIEGGEDDRFASLGSVWEATDNVFYNNLFANTRATTLFDAAAFPDGNPSPNSRVTGRPYSAPTAVAGMDYNGYWTADAADRFLTWDPGAGADLVYNTLSQFESFKAAFGRELNTPTSGPGKLVFDGGPDPFFVNAAGGNLRLRAGTVAADRGTNLRAVPGDILAAAGRPQPTYLGALPLADPDTSPPVAGALADRTIDENTSTGPIAFTVGVSDAAGGALFVSATSTNPDLVPAAGVVLGGSGMNRTLTVTPAPNRAGNAVVTVFVSDAAGNQTRRSFLLTVAATNPRPTISGGSTSVTAPTVGTKNTPLVIPLTVGDNSGAGSVVVTARSFNPEFVRDANIVVGGSGANRTLTLTPEPNTTGQVSLEVTATDANGASTTRRIFLDFRSPDGNRSPRVYAVLDRQIPVGGSTGVIPFTVNDLETPGANLTVTATSSNPAVVPNNRIVLGGSGSNRTVTVNPLPGQSGVAVITLRVRDRGPDGVAGNADDAVGVRRFAVTVGDPPPAEVVLGDAGFETPSVGAGEFLSFRYAPAGGPWAFSESAGVSGNGSGFTGGNPSAPQGAQVAFLQGQSSVGQAVFLAPGTYELTFRAAQRGNANPDGPQTVRAGLAGTTRTFTPAGTDYQAFTGTFTVAAAGTYSLVLDGTVGGDSTAFLDDIMLAKVG